MSLLVVLVIVILLVGAYPGWGYHQFGYYPMGGVGLVLLILLVLLLTGHL